MISVAITTLATKKIFKKKKGEKKTCYNYCLHYLIPMVSHFNLYLFSVLLAVNTFFLIATMATHCYTDKKHFDNGYNIFVPEIRQVTGHDQLFVTALLIL